MNAQPSDFASNIERFSGFAELYDAFRPHPPAVLHDLLAQLAQVGTPKLVVDLGSGTGLSTRFWADHAEQVIGVEPSADMRRQAEAQTSAAHITYREGFSHRTGLPAGCADIVTCSQSLHWMEPQPTFEDVARMLRPGGVFAAYDCDWPPTTSHWEADLAFIRCMDQVAELEAQHKLDAGLQRWSKAQHLARMQASGCFRYTREIVVHQVEMGNADRLVGLALSQGGLAMLLKQGLSEEAIGVDRLRTVAAEKLGAKPKPWYFGYRVRVGVV